MFTFEEPPFCLLASQRADCGDFFLTLRLRSLGGSFGIKINVRVCALQLRAPALL